MVVAGGASVSIGSLNGSGTVTMEGGSISDLQIASGSFAGMITGNEVLEKQTSGSLILSGANSYSGGTTLEGGLLGLGNNSALGTGGLVMNAGTTLQADSNGLSVSNAASLAGAETFDSNSNSATLSGNLSGAGSLSVINSGGTGGNLTLTGSNTYTGPTTLLGGSLTAGSSGALGTNTLVLDGGTFNGGANITLANNIFVGGTSVFILGNSGLNLTGGISLGGNNLIFGSTAANGPATLSGAPTTFSGQITGSGTLEIESGTVGTLVLTHSNSFTGGVTLYGGTLQMDNNSAIGSGLLTLGNGGTLQAGLHNLIVSNNVSLNGTGIYDTNGFDSTVTGNLTGTGSLVVTNSTGTGIVTLTGANNYTGGTTILSGTLQGNTGSLPGNIADNSSLLFFQFASGTYAGIISGSGSVSVTGGTTLTFTGLNTYTGNTGIVTGSVLNLSPTAGLTDNSVILGGGSLIIGSNTVTLGGTNSYSGGTAINGTLVAANSSALGTGNVSVNAGGTLAVSGPRVLNIGGNYTQASTGTLQLGLGGATSGLYDTLNITGTATLGGTLKLVPYSGFQIHDNDTFTLLTASSITGNFTTVTDTLAGDAVSLVYATGSVTGLAPTSVVVTLGPTAPSFTALGLTGNQKSVGAALDNIATNTPGNNLVSYLNTLSNSSIPGAENQMSPSNLTPMFKMGFATAQVEAGMIGQRLSGMWIDSRFNSDTAWNGQPMFAGNMPVDQEAQIARNVQPDRWSAFANGMGNFGTVTSDGNGAGYQFSTGGTTAGVDYRFGKDFAAGLMLGYDQSASSQSTGTVNVSGGQVGLYAGWKSDALHIGALVDGGLDSYTTMRQGLGGNANGNTSGTEFTGQLNAGYDLKMDDYQVSPFVSGQFTQVNVNGFTETGSLSPLTYANQGETYVSSDLGAQISRSWTISGIKFSPNVNAAWEHIYQGNADALTANFGTGNNFTVAGSVTGTDDAVLGAGLNAEFAKGFNVYASYQGKVGLTNYTDQNISGGVNIGF